MRIAFTTLGCKVNQYETENLIELFSKEGYDVVDPSESADVYVVNSCTVTATGDKKTRNLLRRLKKQNPGSLGVLTGCFPQAFPDEALKIPEADVITGSANRGALLDAVRRGLTGERVAFITPHSKGERFEHMAVTGLRGRTRAFVKIEDGCERYCSYCIIPKARGPVRSKSLDDLRDELIALAAAGYREVVLVGVNLSSYGKDLGLRLLDAVKLACAAPGIERVRLGSLEPELLTHEDIGEMAKEKKFCPQFHLSLQSGCDKTLKAMNRHYDSLEYARIVGDIREAFENPSITTDIMVGFPGETEEDFEESLRFAKEIGFAKAHVFAYSKRLGTAAAGRPDQVPANVKEARSKRMIHATDQTKEAFLLSQCATVQSVLLETTKTPLGYEGFTMNYTPVYVNCEESYCSSVCKVRLGAVLDGHCLGTLEGSEAPV